MQKSELLVKLADQQHEIWSHWMKYFFSCCVNEVRFEEGSHFETGNVIVPKEKVERWMRQMNAPYEDLSEKEQQSDIEQAQKILKIFESIAN